MTKEKKVSNEISDGVSLDDLAGEIFDIDISEGEAKSNEIYDDSEGILPPWARGFDPKSFDVPDFPITLKPRLNVVYELTIKAFPPESILTSIGPAYIMEVYNDKMVNSIFLNRSLSFSLEKIRRINNWKLKDLIGKKIFLQKTEGKKDGKDTFYISCKLAQF